MVTFWRKTTLKVSTVDQTPANMVGLSVLLTSGNWSKHLELIGTNLLYQKLIILMGLGGTRL